MEFHALAVAPFFVYLINLDLPLVMKKTLCIKTSCHIHLSDGYLVYTAKEQKEKKEIPIKELSYVMLVHPYITLSHALLAALAKEKVAVIACNEKYLPVGLMLPMAGHYLRAERVRLQWALTPAKKALLWKQVVCAKINNQAAIVRQVEKTGSQYLQEVGQSVSVDNATHKEAQAARHYWAHLFGAPFRRKRLGAPPNAALNYGYALLRSAMARSLAVQGVILSVGIHHHNRYNAFALVDDMMEPYRPLIDLLVYQQQQKVPYVKELTEGQRCDLMTRLATQNFGSISFAQAVERTASTYIEVLQHRRVGIFFPNMKAA